MSNHKINEFCHLFDANSRVLSKHATSSVKRCFLFFFVPNILSPGSEKLGAPKIFTFLPQKKCRSTWASQREVCHQTICWKWFILTEKLNFKIHNFGTRPKWLYGDSWVGIWRGILISCQVGPVHLLAVYA